VPHYRYGYSENCHLALALEILAIEQYKIIKQIHGGVKYFGFNPWKHVFNDVVIRSLDGFVDNRLGYLQISHCGYQDAGTYIPDFNSIPSAVVEKKFLENRPIRIFKVTWWPCFLTNLHKSNNSCVGPHRKPFCQVWFFHKLVSWNCKFNLKVFAIFLLFFVLSALTTSSKMN
jgi:hypothetical protein